MRAASIHDTEPPEVVHIKDVEKPVPKDDEVLVRIRAATVCTPDWRFRNPDPSFLRLMNGVWRPKKINILGMELAGEVESVGKSVTRFRENDQVFGGTGFKFGAHAEYACAPESRLEKKPVNMTFEEAAAVMFGGLTALYFLRQSKIQAGQRVVIYGASGSVGVFAVQLAKHFGARVTGICSTHNLNLVKSLGADEVVDYTKEDFSAPGHVYDMVRRRRQGRHLAQSASPEERRYICSGFIFGRSVVASRRRAATELDFAHGRGESGGRSPTSGAGGSGISQRTRRSGKTQDRN
jgi:NADPH:quinone reductase-like Zn-dependent oxidoreductase